MRFKLSKIKIHLRIAHSDGSIMGRNKWYFKNKANKKYAEYNDINVAMRLKIKKIMIHLNMYYNLFTQPP